MEKTRTRAARASRMQSPRWSSVDPSVNPPLWKKRITRSAAISGNEIQEPVTPSGSGTRSIWGALSRDNLFLHLLVKCGEFLPGIRDRLFGIRRLFFYEGRETHRELTDHYVRCT